MSVGKKSDRMCKGVDTVIGKKLLMAILTAAQAGCCCLNFACIAVVFHCKLGLGFESNFKKRFA